MNDRLAPADPPPSALTGASLQAPLAGAAVPPPARAPLADARMDVDVQLELVALLADLRVCVVNYVFQRRAEGVPVERVVPEVRCLVREAESCEAWSDPEDTLVTHAVRWSLEAYHDDDPAPAVLPEP